VIAAIEIGLMEVVEVVGEVNGVEEIDRLCDRWDGFRN